MSKLLPTPLLNSLLNTPHLPPRTLHLITTVTLCSLNLPHEIPHTYQHALSSLPAGENHHAERLQLTRRIREALIKAAPITGLPKTINALSALKTSTPPTLLDDPSTTESPTGRRAEFLATAAAATHTKDALPLPQRPSPTPAHQRGQAFFDRTYGKIAPQVQHQLDHSGTEDLGVLARLYYSYIFSNTTVLSAAETSYVLIAALIPQDVNPQLKGHLKGALNNGASLENVTAVRSVVLGICKLAGMRSLGERAGWGWGWRGEVANL